jgi:CheY-like chemotaxis protein
VGSIDLRVSQNQDKLVIAVKDTGIGIDKQYHAMIFDRFTQVDSSTTRQYDGSGIGLALCKQLVETIDGTITLHSELGKGSEFIVEIPVKVTEERRHSVPGVSQDEIQYMEQLNVLVCEDNIVNQKIVKKLLTKLGVANIEIANNGKEGVDMLRTSGEKIDVILMDLMMPVMDGTEATKVIRKLEKDGAPLRTRKERVPIICVTANATSGTREDITLAGADLFLTKPIILSELVSALTSCK